MGIEDKRELRARNFKLLSFIIILSGVYTGVQAVEFSTQALQIATDQGLESGQMISVMVYALGLLVPVLLVVSGILGCFKKLTAVMVISAIAFVFAIYGCITNFTSFAATEAPARFIGEAIPMLASAIMPLIFGIYAFMAKKDKAV